MKKSPQSYFNICNIYIFIWVIYTFHWNNTKIPFIEGISNLLLGLNLLISIYYTYFTIKEYKLPRFFSAVKIILFLFIIYGFYYIVYGPDRIIDGQPLKRGTYLVAVLRSFLPIFVFYYFTLKGYLTPKVLKFWSIIFLLSYIYIFYISVVLRGKTENVTDFVNNTGYLFPIAIPCIYYWNKSTIIQYIYIGICFIFTVLSLKRGAMLTAACVIMMFFVFKFKNSSKNAKIKLGVISIFAILLAYNFVGDRIADSVAFQKRINSTMQGSVSHRDVLAADFIHFFVNEADLWQLLFGSGADATVSISDNFAHNDWLELLMDQGIIGVMGYIIFWMCFFLQWRNTKNPILRQIIGSYFIIYFLRSFFSMGYSMIYTAASLGIGYAIAKNQERRNLT